MTLAARSSRAARWRAAVSGTPLGPRLAVALWSAWAFCVWNVIFDRVLVLAGRRYVYAAALSARQSNTYLKIDDSMRPAIAHGFWLATGAGTLVLAVGLAGVALAAKRRTATSTESLQKN